MQNQNQTPQFFHYDGHCLYLVLLHKTVNSLYIKVLHGNAEPMTKLSENQWQITLPFKAEDIGRTLVWSFEERTNSGDLIASEKCQRTFPIDPLTFLRSPLVSLSFEWNIYPFEMTSYCMKNITTMKSVSIRSILEQKRPDNESTVLKQIPLSEHRSLSIDQKGFAFFDMLKEDTTKLILRESMKDYYSNVLYKSCFVVVKTVTTEEKTVTLVDLHLKFDSNTNLEKAFNQILGEMAQYLPKLDLHPNSHKYEFCAQITEESLDSWYNDGWNKKPEEETIPLLLTKTHIAIGNKASPCSHFTNCICSLKKNQGTVCYEGLDSKILVLTNLDTGAVIRVLDVFETQIFNIRSFIFNGNEYIVAVDGKSVRVFEQSSENWRKVAEIRHGLNAGAHCTAELIQCPFGNGLSVLFCGTCADGILHFNLAGDLLQKLPFPAVYTNYIQSEDIIIACTGSGMAKINLSKTQLVKKSNETSPFLKNELSFLGGKSVIFAVSGSNLFIYDSESLVKIKEIAVEGALYDFIEWTFEKNQFLLMSSYSSGKIHVVNPNTGDKVALGSGLGFSSHVSRCVYRGNVGVVVGGCYSKVHVLTKKD